MLGMRGLVMTGRGRGDGADRNSVRNPYKISLMLYAQMPVVLSRWNFGREACGGRAVIRRTNGNLVPFLTTAICLQCLPYIT